jgi:hypothetical protein
MNDDFDYFPFVSNDDLQSRDAWFDNGCPCIDDTEEVSMENKPEVIILLKAMVNRGMIDNPAMKRQIHYIYNEYCENKTLKPGRQLILNNIVKLFY